MVGAEPGPASVLVAGVGLWGCCLRWGSQVAQEEGRSVGGGLGGGRGGTSGSGGGRGGAGGGGGEGFFTLRSTGGRTAGTPHTGHFQGLSPAGHARGKAGGRVWVTVEDNQEVLLTPPEPTAAAGGGSSGNIETHGSDCLGQPGQTPWGVQGAGGGAQRGTVGGGASGSDPMTLTVSYDSVDSDGGGGGRSTPFPGSSNSLSSSSYGGSGNSGSSSGSESLDVEEDIVVDAEVVGDGGAEEESDGSRGWWAAFKHSATQALAANPPLAAALTGEGKRLWARKMVEKGTTQGVLSQAKWFRMWTTGASVHKHEYMHIMMHAHRAHLLHSHTPSPTLTHPHTHSPTPQHVFSQALPSMCAHASSSWRCQA